MMLVIRPTSAQMMLVIRPTSAQKNQAIPKAIAGLIDQQPKC